MPPAGPLKLTKVTDRFKAGSAPTVRVTLTVWGDPVAPAAATVTVSLYVPAASPAMEVLRVKAEGALPEVEDRVSQDCVLLAVHVSVPPPVLEMFTACELGLLPPAVVEKLAEAADKLRTGGKGGG
jgi:hypothetical protein